MKTTVIAAIPTNTQQQHGSPQLTPEMTCAVAARYSRSDEGLAAILEKVNKLDQDKAVDSIFKMVDYGHASIADMADVSIFIDGVSIWLAYYLWSIAPTASGQETSTRYVKFEATGILTPEEAGIPEFEKSTWLLFIQNACAKYNEMTTYWSNIANLHPELVNIPNSVTSAAVIERLKRNFVFDRSRYYIPVAAKTNLMLKMTAREWVRVVRHLSSYHLEEANLLATLLMQQLNLIVPRLTKHATAADDNISGLAYEFLDDIKLAANTKFIHKPIVKVTVDIPPDLKHNDIKQAFHNHTTRYAWIDRVAKRINTRYSINGIAMAELRDLNRHRPGNKYCPQVPVGFYGAEDQFDYNVKSELHTSYRWGVLQTIIMLAKLVAGKPSYMYWGLLGTQYYYERAVSLDKLAYEIALRTGLGAHYKYREHMLEVHRLLIDKIPSLVGMILLGSGEPE